MMRALVAGITILVAVSQTAHSQETWAERLGYPAGKRVVILYADTMGASYEFSRPGQELLAKGRLNSVSVMSPCPWFEEFANWSRENPQHDIGVCLTLNSPGQLYRWRPLTGLNSKTSTLVDPKGYMWGTELQLGLMADPEEIRREIEAQIAKVRAAGIQPTHLHPFMGVLFMREDLLKIYLETAEKNWIPAVVLELTPEKIQHFRDNGVALSDEMIATVHKYRLPKLDDAHFVPEADSYEKKRDQFYELVKGLPPGLTQITAGPADKSLALEAIAPHWQQRVWENQLLNDKAVHDFLKKQDVIFTNWREIMERFENAGGQRPGKRGAAKEKEDLGQNRGITDDAVVRIPTFEEPQLSIDFD
ncbi:hypothetical protein Mal52_42000 [Symmachiella dynata]|uniref:YdjC-like protein n=1 Tax=Symmachiella dynata TaxID=2527995 RepID=A0A517ZTE4_9PLAN|nr:polysaccharide deacetylase family protein [Symmachiella dynata]QDU45705.1 hypothetical protein Mal52_42000 [Symmachiella dynata]